MNFGQKKRWFTLVEMLIVIVIIWVLAAALIPRLTSVRWRANDVARKADLQQVATAVLSYSMDQQNYPTSPQNWESVAGLISVLVPTYVTSLPTDPSNNSMSEYSWTSSYVYVNTMKWNVDKAWFVIISKSETPWWANRAYSWGVTSYLSWWAFNTGSDSQLITPCTKLTQSASWIDLSIKSDCKYFSQDQLRYIIAR
jgi:competence protein ComGC